MNPETGTLDEYSVYRAVENEDGVELQRLLQAGAPKNTTIRGDTALLLAVKRGNVSFVKLLVEHGADCAPRDRYGVTALHLAACPEMFLSYSANLPNSTENQEIIRILVKGGADINSQDRGGDTPLHYTAEYGHVAAMQLLIGRGADVNIIGNNEFTPLQYAAVRNKFECLRLLVLAGARMSPGVYHRSPLHWAVINNNQVAARFLIMHNCDTDILDNDGLTALEFCRFNNIGPLPDASLEMTNTLQDAIREVHENRWTVVMMGHHERLGEQSQMRLMPPELLREMFNKRP
jgi:ankyrin repeat protein